MGFFGPSAVETAVFRQMDPLRGRLWGGHNDDVQALNRKLNAIEKLAAELSKTEDRKVRRAQAKWLKHARQSISNRRIEMTMEIAISQVQLSPLPKV